MLSLYKYFWSERSGKQGFSHAKKQKGGTVNPAVPKSFPCADEMAPHIRIQKISSPSFWFLSARWRLFHTQLLALKSDLAEECPVVYFPLQETLHQLHFIFTRTFLKNTLSICHAGPYIQSPSLLKRVNMSVANTFDQRYP